MGMTGKELLEDYRKRKQGNTSSSEEPPKITETTSTTLSGSQLLDNYRKSRGLATSTEEESKSTVSTNWDKYKEFANTEEASKGWQKYLDDIEASKQAAKAIDDDKKWWEKMLGYLAEGNTTDTSLPLANTTQAINDLRKDVSYKRPKDDWSEEQRLLFGYLYTDSPSKAYEYAEHTNNENNKAKEEAKIKDIQGSATSGFWEGAGHTAGAIATAPLAMADFLNDLAYVNAGRDIVSDGQVSPFEYSQAVTEGISEHLNETGGTLNENIPIIGGKGWGDVYGLGVGIAQSAVSAYTLGGAGTLVSYFGQGAASGVDDALSRGASEEQAILYGTALGVAEGLAEKIGIDNLFKLGASPTLKVAIKNILKQAGAEGLEEGLTSVISNIADNAIMQDKSNFNAMVQEYMAQGMTEAKAKRKAWMDSVEGIAFDTIGGFVSGGTHAGVHTGVHSAIDNNYASKMYGDSVQELLDEAANIGGEAANVADKYSPKYEKRGKLSGANLNEIVYAREQELRTQDKAKIKSAVEAKLTEYGEAGDVSAIADILVKQATGEKLTSKEANTLNKSNAGNQVSGELNAQSLRSGALTNDWAADIGTKRINVDVYNRDLYNLATQKVTKQVDTPTMAEETIESPFKTSESGKTTLDGNEVSIKEIATVKDGDITLRLENGETVNANDVEFSSSDEMLYATVVDMNLNAATANAFIRGFNTTDGLSAEQYARGFREAYKYGSYGFPVQEMSKGGFSADLSESQKSLAYNLGKVDAKYAIEAKQNAVKDTKVTNEFHEDSMSIEEAEAVEGLTDRQKASIKAMKSLSKSLGLKVRFFESAVDAEGMRVGENGRYDPATGIIYIDLHAGFKGEGTILFTAAHELTHHIRKWSPEKFKIFADFLLENYGKKGVSVNALVREQIAKAKRKGRDISYDTAYEEVIADSCERMLADGDVIAKIAKLKAKDRSLWKKIKDFITDLVSKIKEAYKGLKPDSNEGRLVGEMLDVAERLKALWVDALVDASDSYNTAEKTLAESGIAVNPKTESASLLSVRDVLSEEQRKKVSLALAQRFGVTQKEAMEWLKAETSMASLILNPKYSQYLDYTPDPNEVAIKTNSDYPQGTVDFSPICAKRREFTSVMNNILRLFPNHVFAATDLAKIRTIMQEEGMTIPCGICYVEDRRQLDTIVAQNFIDSLKLYREGSKTRPDGKPFNANQLKGLSLIDGDSYTPSVYELVSLEGLNVLKEKNPNMAEAWVKFNNARGMQSVRLLANEAEYKRQILKYTKQTVKAKNDKGGLRVYSFSDAEMFHLIDIIQVITDSATVGLSLQGYTKVNEYARAVKDTGEKLNRSLIPKGELGYHIEDGKVVLDYDTVEGIDINHPDFFDNRDNPNVGNITIGVSDVQIRAAMVSDFVDQIIPFHTGQSEEVLGEKGIATWANYKDFQTEKDIATGKVSDHQINIYTEVLQVLEKEGKPINKRTFVEKFLQVCTENNLTPRFSQFLNTNEKGEYVYTEGYHKMLVDFKTFAQTEVGEYLPQMPVKPIFDNEYITKILKDYVKSQKVKDAELAESMPKVIDRITNEIVKPSEVKYSEREYSYENRPASDYYTNGTIYTYDFLTAQKDMVAVELPGTGALANRKGKVDDAKVLSEGTKNALSEGVERDGKLYVKNVYTGRELRIDNSTIKHGLDGTYNRHLTNARIGSVIGSVVKNAIPINGLKNTSDKAIGTYAMVAYCHDSQKRQFVAIVTVEQHTGNVDSFELYDVAHAVSGRQKKGSQVDTKSPGVYPIEATAISISQLLEIVNNTHQSILSDDVLAHLGETRNPKGTYSDKVLFSDRDTDSVSDRSLLANALESVAQNDIEKTKLAQYKEKIALIESEQKKLAETRAKIKELSFAKGARDAKAINKLQFEANQTANRINTYDKQLLSLESTKALKGVLEREKATLRKRMEQKNKESLATYREKVAKTQRELLTRYQESRKKGVESRNKTAMRHKIQKVVSDLNKLLLNPTKEQHVPIGLQSVVADALDAINMDTMNAEERVKYYNDLIAKSSDPDDIKALTKKRDFFEYRDMSFKEKITALKNAYAEFKESDDPLIRNAHNDAIEDLIKNTVDAVGNSSLKDMSLAQLEAVYDMYKAVLATVRNANKMFKEGRQETVTENSESVKVQVKNAGGHQERVLKATKFLKKFGWNMLKPVTAMKVIGSKTLARLFDNVRSAEDTWAVDVREAKDFYETISEKYGYSKWDFKTQHSFKDSRGEEFSISLEQMLSLYAYSKRAQADEHLEFGGFIFDDAIEVTEKNKFGIPMKYEVNDANPHRLSKIEVVEIIGKLTQEQRDFVDEMQTYLSEVMGAKGNEVSLAMYDIKLYKEKNYFPLKTARYFREFDPEKSGTPKLKNSGFSKKTAPQAGNPIVLSNFMDVWASHVNDMSMYHAFVLPLEDFMRVYNYSSTAGGYDSVQQYIKNAYGSQANQYIERLMDDLNGGARVDSSADPINKGISLFKKASVFASVSVVVQQPSAIARALAYINPKYFATSAGSALNLKKHKEVWEEVKKYAPIAVIKEMGYFDTGMGRSTVEWIKGNKTIKDKMDDALSKAPAMADELSWSYIWLAVKNEIKATTNLTPGSEEFLAKVGERFTEIVTNTQVYDSVLSRSGMMRSKDTGMKMATAFMAEPTTTVNMMVDGIIQGKRGNKKFAASTVGAISASIILNSILVALVYAARDDDEDETYTEKYVGSLTSELVDGFNPLTYIPFVKDVWSIAQGYDVERSDMSVVSNLWESIEGLFNENKSGLDKVTDATGAVSSLFGIPLKNILRDAKGMYNLTETLLNGTPTTSAGISKAIGDAFTSAIPLWDRLHESDSNADRLYEAMISGDRAQINRIKGRYATEQAAESAMRQALRDNDSRIHKAAQARYEGDIAEYTRIAKQIIREGNFSQDLVVGAINAEMNAIKRGETTEEAATENKDEATSIYSGSDVNSAFDNGDTTLAKSIISDLIETKMANGMDEKSAKSSLRSSMTSYWKTRFQEAYQADDSQEMARIRQILYSSGLYGSANDVVKTTQGWLKS